MKPVPTRALSRLVLAAALVFTAACGDDGPAPEAGSVDFVLRSPAGAEGGAVFLVGDEVVIQGRTGEGFLFVRQTEDGTRVVVVRETPGEIRFGLTVEDVHRPPALEVEQVSGPDDALRPSLEGYRVEAVR